MMPRMMMRDWHALQMCNISVALGFLFLVTRDKGVFGRSRIGELQINMDGSRQIDVSALEIS